MRGVVSNRHLKVAEWSSESHHRHLDEPGNIAKSPPQKPGPPLFGAQPVDLENAEWAKLFSSPGVWTAPRERRERTAG